MGAGASTEGLTPEQKRGISRELQSRYAESLETTATLSDADSVQVYKSLADAYDQEVKRVREGSKTGFVPSALEEETTDYGIGIDEVVGGPVVLVKEVSGIMESDDLSGSNNNSNGNVGTTFQNHIDDDFDHKDALVRAKTSQDILSEMSGIDDHHSKISSFINSLKDGDISTTRTSKFRIRRLTYSQRTVESPEPDSPVTKLTKRTTIYASTEIGVRQEKVAPFPDSLLGTFSCHGIEPSDEDDSGGTGIHDKINQDRGCVVYPYNSSSTEALFLALDGHGEQGDKVSEFVMRQIVISLEKHPSLSMAFFDPELALKETFIKTNIALMATNINYMTSGSTCVCAYVNGTKLFVANCGDSRAVMASGSSFESLKAKNLSRDHKPDDPEESKRITEWGGFILPAPEPGLTARVYLDAAHTMIGLAMARSIGDFAVKNVGVIAEPEVLEFEIGQEDQFMILASDGVWEFIYSQEAVDIVASCLREGKSVTQACQVLIEQATNRWQEEEGDYRDDITAIVIRFPLPYMSWPLQSPTA